MSVPTQSDLEMLCNTPLFAGMERQAVSDALQGRCCIRRFAKGSILPEPGAAEQAANVLQPQLVHTLLILLEGRAVVRARTPAGAGAVLNQFTPGSIFGAATVFSEADDAVSEVIAERDCRVLVIGQQQFWTLLNENPEVLRRYLQFLSGRIGFSESENRLLYDLRQRAAPCRGIVRTADRDAGGGGGADSERHPAGRAAEYDQGIAVSRHGTVDRTRFDSEGEEFVFPARSGRAAVLYRTSRKGLTQSL